MQAQDFSTQLIATSKALLKARLRLMIASCLFCLLPVPFLLIISCYMMPGLPANSLFFLQFALVGIQLLMLMIAIICLTKRKDVYYQLLRQIDLSKLSSEVVMQEKEKIQLIEQKQLHLWQVMRYFIVFASILAIIVTPAFFILTRSYGALFLGFIASYCALVVLGYLSLYFSKRHAVLRQVFDELQVQASCLNLSASQK